MQSSVKRQRNFKTPLEFRLLRQYFVVHLAKVGHWVPKITLSVDLVIFGHQVVSFTSKYWSRSVMRIISSDAYISKLAAPIFLYDTSKFSSFQGLSIGRKKLMAIFDLGGVFQVLIQLYVNKGFVGDIMIQHLIRDF